jgi:hypothetical protein
MQASHGVEGGDPSCKIELLSAFVQPLLQNHRHHANRHWHRRAPLFAAVNDLAIILDVFDSVPKSKRLRLRTRPLTIAVVVICSHNAIHARWRSPISARRRMSIKRQSRERRSQRTDVLLSNTIADAALPQNSLGAKSE